MLLEIINNAMHNSRCIYILRLLITRAGEILTTNHRFIYIGSQPKKPLSHLALPHSDTSAPHIHTHTPHTFFLLSSPSSLISRAALEKIELSRGRRQQHTRRNISHTARLIECYRGSSRALLLSLPLSRRSI